MRSRSRWNGVRRRHSSSSACARPRVSYERTASGREPALLLLADRAPRTAVRTRHAAPGRASAHASPRRASADRLDDDGDVPAVRAPRASRHVAGAVRAQEDDHGGDLLRLGQPPERPALADAVQDLLAALPRPLARSGRRGRRRRATPARRSARARRRCRGSRPSRRGRRRGATARARRPSSRV